MQGFSVHLDRSECLTSAANARDWLRLVKNSVGLVKNKTIGKKQGPVKVECVHQETAIIG